LKRVFRHRLLGVAGPVLAAAALVAACAQAPVIQPPPPPPPRVAAAAEALTAAQKIDPARKAKAAEKAVNAATAAATGAGFTPIPFADAAVLVPIQIGMMAKIANIYDIPMQRATVASLAATTVTTQAGRAAATGLLKLVPGVGTIAGGVIPGGVAGGLTYAGRTAGPPIRAMRR